MNIIKFIAIYKCYNRTQHKGRCDGVTTYRAQKVDAIVREDLRLFFKQNYSSLQICALAKEWEQADFPVQKMMLAQLLERVVIFSNTDVRVTFREFSVI